MIKRLERRRREAGRAVEAAEDDLKAIMEAERLANGYDRWHTPARIDAIKSLASDPDAPVGKRVMRALVRYGLATRNGKLTRGAIVMIEELD